MVISLLIGIMAGIVSGLIPGVGSLVTVLLFFPFLITLEPLNILTFYVALCSISQYVGSVPALTMGIPGDSSSLPAVIERKNLNGPKDINDAIVGSAVGSLFGSFIVVIVCLLLKDSLQWIIKFYNTKTLIVLLTVCVLLICKTSSRNFWMNCLLFLFGAALSSVGHNSFLNKNIMTFDVDALYNGIPLVVVSIVLFALPQMYQCSRKNYKYQKVNFLKGLKIPNITNTIRNSVIGFFGGLMPGMTTVFSSNLAYSVSKIKKQDCLNRIWASETANNAGAFSQLLPLIAFGIPILGSEAIILSLIEQKGFMFETSKFSDMLVYLALILIPINIVGLVVAWPLSRTILKIFLIGQKNLYVIICCLLVAVIIYTGIKEYALTFYIVSTLVLIPIAWLLKNMNTMPLVFGFLICDLFLENIIRLIQLS